MITQQQLEITYNYIRDSMIIENMILICDFIIVFLQTTYMMIGDQILICWCFFRQ